MFGKRNKCMKKSRKRIKGGKKEFYFSFSYLIEKIENKLKENYKFTHITFKRKKNGKKFPSNQIKLGPYKSCSAGGC